ncbi:MAG: futalosine hydrolase [bacterium]
MNLLIAAATDKELEAVKRHCIANNSTTIRLLTTGVGSVASCFTFTDEIAKQSPDLIIQIGIAGSFSNDLSIGSAVAVSHEIIADMGVIEADGYKNIFQLGLAQPDIFPYSNGALVNTHHELFRMTGMKMVIGVTVNEITTQPEKISLFSNEYGAEVESMEGAALHYVGIMKKIPFIQIRGISNSVGERDKSKWKINEAIASASDACIELINNLMTRS